MKRFNLFFVAVGLILVGSRVSGGPVTTIVNNGPSSNRVDIVFLGDGYTTADIAAGTYVNHINNYLNYMFSSSLNSDPFFRYRNYFNVHSIEVVSNEAGADVPPENIFRDTALGASYYGDGSTERLLSVSIGKANAVRDAALAGAGFTGEMQYVTVNDTRYGGSGVKYAVYAGGNGLASELALHEMVHSFSYLLADEYGGLPGPFPHKEPGWINVTKDATGAKWSRWLGYDQPGIGLIGAYEGGNHYDTGIYRPSNTSKMRTLNYPFNAVGRERLILDIYDLVDPFDSWRVNSTPLIDPGELFVNRIDDNVIEVEWFVDGALVPTASGETFDLTDFGYGPGDYLISARGFDPTAFDPVDGWVRMNQSELEQYVFWNVGITVPEPSTFLLFTFGVLLLALPITRRLKRRVPLLACPAVFARPRETSRIRGQVLQSNIPARAVNRQGVETGASEKKGDHRTTDITRLGGNGEIDDFGWYWHPAR